MIEDLKSGKLPVGFELRYIENANEVLDLLSFSRMIDRALKPSLASHSTLSAQSRQKLYEMHK